MFFPQKLEWGSLSIDLLPHPDMFADARLTSPNSRESKRDEDGAKRLFFGGERFLEGISGQANVMPIYLCNYDCQIQLKSLLDFLFESQYSSSFS